jgi:hypothetical protein
VSNLAYAPGRFFPRAVISLAAATALAAGAVSAASASAAPAASTPGWRVTAVVPSGSTYPTTFTAIGAVSAKDAWVAGTTGDSGGLLLERWNGSTWKPFAAPGFGSNVNDYAVGTTSATNVWTFPEVGTTGYGLHWNGGSWAKFTFKNVLIDDADVLGPKSVWVFGWKAGRAGNRTTPYAAYYNGRTWKQSSVPAAPSSVTALSASDIWGIGLTSKGTDIAMHWNGRAWSTLTIPSLPKSHGIRWYAYYAAATSAHDLWVLDGLALDPAQGTSPPGVTLLHWNGHKWSVAARNSRWWLYGLTPDGHGGFWLTGEKNQPIGFASFNSYIVHYSGGHWTYQTAPARSGYTGPTAGLITPIRGTHSFWALGQLSSASNPFGAADILKYGP